jgi:hypothetical protein
VTGTRNVPSPLQSAGELIASVEPEIFSPDLIGGYSRIVTRDEPEENA